MYERGSFLTPSDSIFIYNFFHCRIKWVRGERFCVITRHKKSKGLSQDWMCRGLDGSVSLHFTLSCRETFHPHSHGETRKKIGTVSCITMITEMCKGMS